MLKNTKEQTIYQKILESITSSPESLKKITSLPIINIPIASLLLDSKDISDIFQKEEETEYTIGNYLIKRT